MFLLEDRKRVFIVPFLHTLPRPVLSLCSWIHSLFPGKVARAQQWRNTTVRISSSLHLPVYDSRKLHFSFACLLPQSVFGGGSNAIRSQTFRQLPRRRKGKERAWLGMDVDFRVFLPTSLIVWSTRTEWTFLRRTNSKANLVASTRNAS